MEVENSMQYLKEYWYGFSLSKKRSKKDIVYLLMIPYIYSGFFGVESETWMSGLIRMLTIMLPMVLIAISIYLHPTSMTKLEYLCPMNQQMRKQKIISAYITRVVIHLVIAAIGIIILDIFIDANLFFEILIIVNDIALSTLTLPCEKKRVPEEGWGVILFYAVMILALISNCVTAGFFIATDVNITWKAVSLIMILLILAPPYLKNIKCIKRTLNEAIDYE